MATVSDIKAGRAYVEIGANDSALVNVMNHAAGQLQKFGSAIRGIGLQVAGAGAALFAPLAGAGEAFAEHGEQLKRNSEKTGIGVGSLSTLGYAAQQTGGDTESLVGGLEKMSKTLTSAAEGGTKARDALTAVGLTVGQLNNLSQEDRLKVITDGLKNIHDPAARAAAAMGIFGKGGAELLPLLDQGSAGITAMQDHAKALGLQWSGEDASAAQAFSRTLKDLWDVMNHGVDVIGSAVAPVLSRMAQYLTLGMVAATKWVSQHKGLIQTALIVGASLLAAGTAVVALGTAFSFVGIAIGTVASILGTIAAGIGLLLSPLGLVIGALVGAGAALYYFSDVGAQVGNAIQGVFKSVYDAIKFVFDNTSSLSEAWGAAQTEVGLMIMQAWASVKGYLMGIWIDFKGFMQKTWNEIGTDIAQAAMNAADGFLGVWAKAMHAWNSMVNTTAKLVQKTFFETSDSQLQAELARIQGLQDSGKLSKENADKARDTAHATFDTYDQKQYAANDKSNDDDLDAKLKSIKDEADARNKYLDDLKAKQKAMNDTETAEAQAKNKKEMDDAIAAAKTTREAYEAELKKAHDASGNPSLTTQLSDQLKKLDFKMPSLGSGDDDALNSDDLASSVKEAHSSRGSFGAGGAALASEFFGGGQDKSNQDTAKNTGLMVGLMKQMLKRPGGAIAS